MSRRGRTAAWLTVLAVLIGFGLLGALPRSTAVVGGQPATTDMAQVRIFENGEFVGGGTVVDPHWVLTVVHLFRRTDSPAYSLAFGVVNENQDPDDQSNLRHIDRIVLHPTLADVALVHVAQAVPSTVRIPPLAQDPPPRYAAVRMFGWGPSGRRLTHQTGPVIDPVARENAAAARASNPVFARSFPAGVEPMVVDLLAQAGDSGSGVFDRSNNLLGVHFGEARYHYVTRSGNLSSLRFLTSYEEPIWHFRDWINHVISGEGPSDPQPPHDELKRRRLAHSPAGGKLPMTLPPQTVSSSNPTWPVATLTSGTGTQGLVTVACPTVGGATNSCTQEINGQLKETIGNDEPVKIRVGSGRQVVAWCRATGSLAKGAQPGTVVRVSFTNSDTAVASNPPPTGYGWYDVNPTQLRTGPTAIDPTSLAPC